MSLQIDDDWKKQAQEEKRKLAEAEAAKKAAPAPVAAAGGGGRGGRQAREVPGASFSTMVQSMMTQALYYLGELGQRQGQSAMDLDMAKMQIDLLGLLEEKTKGNLDTEEQGMLDSALYETRMRFVAVAREVITI